MTGMAIIMDTVITMDMNIIAAMTVRTNTATLPTWRR